jgi:hypothetical protein
VGSRSQFARNCVSIVREVAVSAAADRTTIRGVDGRALAANGFETRVFLSPLRWMCRIRQ